MNVTITDPTAQSNLRLFPADEATPLTSNLNWLPGQSPTPNKVDVKLSPDGKIKLFNFNGTVNVLADIFGYYTDLPLQEFAPSPVKVTATNGATLATARTAAPETLLFRQGTIEVYAKCMYDTTLGEINGEMYVRTTANGAMMEGFDDLPGDAGTGPGTVFLDTTTLEIDRQLELENNPTADSALYDEAEVAITASDGKNYSALTSIGIKQGSPAGGNGPFGGGNICLFGGVILG